MKHKMSKLIPSLRPPKEGRVGVRHERRGNPNSRHRERSVAILQKIASPLRGIAMTPLSVIPAPSTVIPAKAGIHKLYKRSFEGSLHKRSLRAYALRSRIKSGMTRIGRKTLIGLITFILVILPVTLLILFNSAKGVEAAWANEDWGLL